MAAAGLRRRALGEPAVRRVSVGAWEAPPRFEFMASPIGRYSSSLPGPSLGHVGSWPRSTRIQFAPRLGRSRQSGSQIVLVRIAISYRYFPGDDPTAPNATQQ